MPEIVESLESAFERLLTSDRKELTQRMQMWMAFKAGADWALAQAKHKVSSSFKEAFKEPIE